MKTFTFKATEDELKALIRHHSADICNHNNPNPDMSERLHFLMKKLHKDAPDVDADTDATNSANQQPKQEQATKQTGW